LIYSSYLGHLIAYQRIRAAAAIVESIRIILKGSNSCSTKCIIKLKIFQIIKTAPSTMFVRRLTLSLKLIVRNVNTKGTNHKQAPSIKNPVPRAISPDITLSIEPFSYRNNIPPIVIAAAVNIHNTNILIFRIKIFIISPFLFYCPITYFFNLIKNDGSKSSENPGISDT